MRFAQLLCWEYSIVERVEKSSVKLYSLDLLRDNLLHSFKEDGLAQWPIQGALWGANE